MPSKYELITMCFYYIVIEIINRERNHFIIRTWSVMLNDDDDDNDERNKRALTKNIPSSVYNHKKN